MDEFEVIAEFFAPLSAGAAGAFGLSDDAAVFDVAPGRQLVATMDALVSGVHFFADDPPQKIAQKLLRVNLSDLAAMGAVPAGYLLTCVYNRTLDSAWIKAFADGLAKDQEEFFLPLLGGDTVMTDGPATFSLTALGTVANDRTWRRNTAQVGDKIFVTGTIGDSALGLALRKSQLSPEITEHLNSSQAAFLIDRYQVPQPRLGLCDPMQGLISAAIDISDGLISDLSHICELSGLAAEISLTAIPLSEAAQGIISVDQTVTQKILSGGDDYELILAATDERAIEQVAERTGIAITPIGQFSDGTGITVIGFDGQPLAISETGFRHF